MSSRFPQIKFCGVRTLADVQAVNELLAEEVPGVQALAYVGFVFYPPSKRAVTTDEAAFLAKALNPQLAKVGVFVDEPLENVVRLHKEGTIDVAQLHGSETASYLDQLRASAPQLQIWKACEVASREHAQAALQIPADLLLLDAGKGSGETFDWSFAQEVAQVHDQARSQAQSCMKARAWGLAGGMNARTVKSALAAFTPQFPQLIDVSSGIEGAPSEEGLSCKSPQRMREFLRVVDEEVKRWQA